MSQMSTISVDQLTMICKTDSVNNKLFRMVHVLDFCVQTMNMSPRVLRPPKMKEQRTTPEGSAPPERSEGPERSARSAP